MQSAEILLTLAEVSIAFVGFSALVVTLRERRRTGWSFFESIAIRAPVQAGLAALLFSLLPLFLTQLPLQEPAVWRLSSGGLAFYLLGAVVYSERVRLRVAREEAERLRPLAHYTRFGFWSAAFLLQLVNLVGTPASWPYLFGLAWLLAFGGLFFLRLFTVFQPTGADPE